MVFTNTKVFLAQWGITHWGPRAKVIGYEAHDVVRRARMQGCLVRGALRLLGQVFVGAAPARRAVAARRLTPLPGAP